MYNFFPLLSIPALLFQVKDEVVVHMVLGDLLPLPDPEGIWHNILKIKWIVVLRLAKTGDPDVIFHPEHPEIFVQKVKVPLQCPVIKIGPGIVRAIDAQVMRGIILEISISREQDR